MGHYDEQREEAEMKAAKNPDNVVAVHLKSESADNYLELFIGKSLNEIKEYFEEGLFSYDTICDWRVVRGPNTKPSFEGGVEEILFELAN